MTSFLTIRISVCSTSPCPWAELSRSKIAFSTICDEINSQYIDKKYCSLNNSAYICFQPTLDVHVQYIYIWNEYASEPYKVSLNAHINYAGQTSHRSMMFTVLDCEPASMLIRRRSWPAYPCWSSSIFGPPIGPKLSPNLQPSLPDSKKKNTASNPIIGRCKHYTYSKLIVFGERIYIIQVHIQ
jgi:hypothetical protein